MINFDVNDKFNKDKNFTQVKFGENAPLLEVELNEMQKIHDYKVKELSKSIFRDGIIEGTVNFNNGKITVTNSKFIVEGDIINVDSLNLNVNEGDKVYLKLWKEVVDSKSVLKKNGNQQGIEILNDILDKRVGSETSRRIQVKFDLVKNTNDLNASYVKLGEIKNGEFNNEVINVKELPYDLKNGNDTYAVGLSIEEGHLVINYKEVK